MFILFAFIFINLNIKPPNTSFCLTKRFFELDINVQSLRSTFGEFPLNYYKRKNSTLVIFPISYFGSSCSKVFPSKISSESIHFFFAYVDVKEFDSERQAFPIDW